MPMKNNKLQVSLATIGRTAMTDLHVFLDLQATMPRQKLSSPT